MNPSIGAGMVQGVIERLDVVLKPDEDEGLGHGARVTVAVVTLSIGGLVGMLGIVDLIAQGYTAMAFAMAAVYIIPVCTLGVYKLAVHGSPAPASVSSANN